MNDSGIIRRPDTLDSGIFLRTFALDPDGGVELKSVRPGSVLEVQTRNTTYTVIPQSSGEIMIWGHPQYCPEPVLLSGLGSVYVTGVLRKGYLGTGMRLSFRVGDHYITTSRIVGITAKLKH